MVSFFRLANENFALFRSGEPTTAASRSLLAVLYHVLPTRVHGSGIMRSMVEVLG